MLRANGKLLLTSEYYVLDGAHALALPTRFGQTMKVEELGEGGMLLWRSYTVDGDCWFKASFSLPDLIILETSDSETAKTLQGMLKILSSNKPDKFLTKNGLIISTHLDFPRRWGLGTSSTLIWLLGKWAGYNPYHLLFHTMGGSGYDIACAGAKGPLLYQLENYETTKVTQVDFLPPFQDQLYFVYLGKKQNSRNGIIHYRKMVTDKQKEINQLTEITNSIISCKKISEFNTLITEHEKIIGSSLKLPIVKKAYFKDFPGSIKSLGAWGGDFILVSSEIPYEKVKNYFNEKGLKVFLRYREMVLPMSEKLYE